MGSNTSKSFTETAAQVQKNDLNVNANPDPRSPTPEITRTPLQGKNADKHNITKNVDLRKTFENGTSESKLIHDNPILTAVIKNHLQSYDPRSPSQDFERTPIVILTKNGDTVDDKNKLKLSNENLFGSPCLKNDNSICDPLIEEINLTRDMIVAKNLCDGFYDLSLNESQDTEQLLQTQTGLDNTTESEKMAIPTKLLETNFDYIENFEDSEGLVTKDEISNMNMKNSDFEIKNVPLFKILTDDPRSPSTGIERTPIVVANIEDKAVNNVEEMSDDTLIKVLQSTNNEICQIINFNDKTLEGISVYEDNLPLNDTPKKAKSVSTNGARTPLSCMKNKTDMTHARSKMGNTNDLNNENPVQQKKTKHISHIPRLKSLSKKISTGSSVSLKNISKASIISGDCENTPPHSHRDLWDKDSSLVL